MGELYGVTPKGFVLRRFDTIYADLAERIKRYAGIDITANENSAARRKPGNLQQPPPQHGGGYGIG